MSATACGTSTDETSTWPSHPDAEAKAQSCGHINGGISVDDDWRLRAWKYVDNARRQN